MSANEGIVSPESKDYSPTELDFCPNGGLVWTYGLFQSEVAAQLEYLLDRQGINAQVKARPVGEGDQCGNFFPYSMQYYVTVVDDQRLGHSGAQLLSDGIYEVVKGYSELPIDIVKISYPQENITITKGGSVPSFFANTAYWQQSTTNKSPTARYTYGAAYDSSRNVTVLFGGDNTGSARLADTWEYDGHDWREILPGTSPPGRANIDQTLVYDSIRQRVVLFGGLGKDGYLNDTWEYDGATWREIESPTAPEKRDSHAMAYDSLRGETLLFGGYNPSRKALNDTWTYDGEWHQQTTQVMPLARLHHALTYDSNRNVFVLFGGLTGNNGSRLGDTWEYDGESWNEVFPTISPPARDNHSLAYDSERGVVVLFGGEDQSGVLNDTWEYDGTTWRQVSGVQTSPSPRKEFSLVYDAEQEKTILFGGGYWGGSGLVVNDDTWLYDGPPPPIDGAVIRNVYVIVYDPLLSNGQLLSDYLNWYSHEVLTQGTIDFFELTSDGFVKYVVADTTVVSDGWPEKVDGFRYSESEYLAVINGQQSPHSPDGVDYNKIVNDPDLDICGRLNRGEIDEVWIYNGPAFGFYESTLVGPGAYWYNSPPVPGLHNCNRILPIMGPSPERGLDSAVHNFGHRTESTMTEVYGVWQQNSTVNNWEKFALVDSLSPNYNYSGCGNVHYPPNGTSDYDYANHSVAMSNCSDFTNYPNLGNPSDVLQAVTCSSWECDQLKYLGYWFSNLPNNLGCGSDEVASNWWLYFSDPAAALDPSSPCRAKEPTLEINFDSGRQGSYFTITGKNFPPGSKAQVTINGIAVTANLETNSLGSIELILDTKDAGNGVYQVTISVNPSAMVSFTLAPSEPLRPKTSDATVIAVPSGLGLETVMLPFVTSLP